MVRKDGRTAPRFRPQRHRRAIRAGSHKTPHRLHAVVADEPTMSLGVTRSLSGVLVLGSFAQGSFSTSAAGSQGRTGNRCIWRARRHFGYHQLLEPAPGAANGDKSSGCGVFKRGRSEKGQIKYLAFHRQGSYKHTHQSGQPASRIFRRIFVQISSPGSNTTSV